MRSLQTEVFSSFLPSTYAGHVNLAAAKPWQFMPNRKDGSTIGLYRENAIAIESEARDPFGGNVYYVTMQITFPIPEFARKERNLHCDGVHVTTKWVSRLVLDHAIAAIQTSR